jgi:Ca2+-binding RTX toxin-like protein
LPNGVFGKLTASDPDGGSAPTFTVTSLTATDLRGEPVTGFAGDITITSGGDVSAQGLDGNRRYTVTFTITQDGNTFSEVFSVITGTNGVETIVGINGDDVIFADGAGDTLAGGLGNDTLFGQSGDDRILGGAGNDVLWGGSGEDSFVFDTALNSSTNVDVIRDFEAGGNGNRSTDRIVLDDAIFTAFANQQGLTEGQFVANANGTAVGTGAQIIFNTSTGTLVYDADGVGMGAGTHFATLTLGSGALSGTLDFTDFIIM